MEDLDTLLADLDAGEAEHLGSAATYVSPLEVETPCRVSFEDYEERGGMGLRMGGFDVAHEGGEILFVRSAEVAAPAAGGLFRMLDSAGALTGVVYRIGQAPLPVSQGRRWRCSCERERSGAE